MKKYCVKCGKQFDAVGREVICPDCKEAVAQAAKRAAVMRAKRASWAGESVPVRISGRASTLIREYATANDMAFAAALDALLQSTSFFTNIGTAWSTIVPYKSHRRDKQEDKQDVPQDVPQASKPHAAKVAKASASKTVKAAKAAGKATSKASK